MTLKPTREQEQIFNFFEKGKGHGMMDAVAGSGKTSTIVNGIDFINKNTQILFCAFNKKIQEEIHGKTREKGNVIARTTYALGLGILKYHYDIIRRNPEVDTSKYFNILNDKKKSLTVLPT